MKNKKGFTLVEALAVITILAVIIVIATLTLKNLSESSKNQTFKVLANSMQDSVREAYSKCMVDSSSKYCQDHPMLDLNEYDVITLGELVSNKFSDHFQNPWNEKEKCDLNSTVKVIRKLEGTEIDYDYEVCLVCGGKKTCEPLTERGIHKSYAAGLYDENDKLIISYGRLVDEYGYDVETHHDVMYYENNGQLYSSKTGKVVATNSVPNYALSKILLDEKYKDAVKMVLPDSVKTIERGAFYKSKLQIVVLSNGITTIEDHAFTGSKLNQIAFPDSVSEIGAYAFYDCDSLTSVTVPSKITTLSNYAFGDCNNLLTFEAKSNITDVGAGVFYSNKKLTEVNIGKEIINIGDEAFYSTSSLDIDIGTKVKNIGAFAFRSSKISRAILPNIETIGESGFDQCIKLVELELGNKITVFNKRVFFSTHISSLNIPNSVTIIGDSALGGTSLLETITIPNSVVEIGGGAFSTSGIKSINLPEGNLRKIGSTAFWKCQNLEEIVIPEGVTEIGQSAFSKCTNLKKIVYPSTTEFLDMLTTDCPNLSTIIIPEGVKKLGGSFISQGMKAYTSITIPASVNTLLPNALTSTALQQITFKNPNGWKDGDTPLSPSIMTDNRELRYRLTGGKQTQKWTRSD